ncbi:helix-hairpin-helix domain-containing protein [Providencia vermicola]|uniref:Helix-hairpin-helix domain-containing protein n=2 Tax=Providencia TaxID=586 RepID=A0AAI9MVG2_PROST|nr:MULTISPECIES: helix-hairpin-helix domain-containing protein [Providencia]ELR5045282.1 helix-hairpin-helix domain-containing protein [Providencia rettgeri]ELR5035783.1 helix-hairpin-helix domain-containing protein [Providencia stuartii]ELR5121786.1 helix-hairpin-helix domain-containing protein [Providencia stuartii]ELR5140947.1 helix-hairpin-helix domain-containing protein [Providencia stuartii]ELR5290344.1 helix-hairpin-helix domain-containing protein [Providencia stuartii]
MGFSEADKQCLLAVKGVGPTVMSRLEQMGFSTLSQLSEASYEEILRLGAELTGSSCWKNSPQAKKAVEGAINAAKMATK